jgi:hypothetical protein
VALQAWADWLDGAEGDANVVPLRPTQDALASA